MCRNYCKFCIFLTILILNSLPQSLSIIHHTSFNKKLLEAPTIIETPEVHDVGLWSEWEKCPRGHYIFGLRIQYLPVNPHDNEGLIGIKFLCGEQNAKRTVSREIGFSKNPERGHWTQNLFCGGPAQAILVRNVGEDFVKHGLDHILEKKAKYRNEVDLVGITNVKLICSEFNETIEPRIEYQPGDWTAPLLCNSDKQALCGVKVQEGEEILSGETIDAVGLNRLKIECCEILSPELTCTPWDRWEVITDFDNSLGLHPARYSYTKRVGVSRTTGLTTIDKKKHKFTALFKPGYSSNLTLISAAVNFGTLSFVFGASPSVGKGTGFEWHQASSDTWSLEKSVNIRVNIDPGYRTRLYQVVGYCGDYVIRPDWIYQNGSFAETKKRGVIDSSGQRRLRFTWKIAFAVLSSFLSSAHMYFT